MNKKYVVCIGLILTVIAVVVYNRVFTTKVIRVAMNLPLSGPVASFMGDYTEAVKQGVYDECQSAGIDYASFNFDIQDNGWDVPRAVSIYQKQALTPIGVYISGTSPQSIAVTPLTENSQIPHFLIAFDARLTETGANLFRILPNYRVINPGFETYIKNRNAKRVLCIQMNISSHEEQYNLLEEQFKGTSVRFFRERIDGGFQDFRTLVSKVKDLDPDLILVSLYSYQMSPLIDALKQEAVIRNHNTLFIPDFIDLIHEGVAATKLSGILFSCPVFELSEAKEYAREWKVNWTKKHKKVPGYIEAYGYDTGRIIARAFKDGKISSESLIAQFPFKGVSGEIILDSNRDMISTLTLAEVMEDGRVVEFVNDQGK